MNQSEKDFIRKNIQFGFSDNEEFPGLSDGEVIPWVAVPNMVRPDGSVRSFSSKEVIDYLLEDSKGEGEE